MELHGVFPDQIHFFIDNGRIDNNGVDASQPVFDPGKNIVFDIMKFFDIVKSATCFRYCEIFLYDESNSEFSRAGS